MIDLTLLTSERHPNFKSGVQDASTSPFLTKNVTSFRFNCEHFSPPHTYDVSPPSKTKTSNVINESLDATTSVTYMSRPSSARRTFRVLDTSGATSFPEEIHGPDPCQTLLVAEFLHVQDGVASKS